MRIDGIGPMLTDAYSGASRVQSRDEKAAATKSESKDDAKLRDACRDFETVFVNNLLKSMRKTVVKSGLFGDQREQEMFQDMMDHEVSKSVSKSNSVGIADMLYRQLSAERKRAEQ